MSKRECCVIILSEEHSNDEYANTDTQIILWLRLLPALAGGDYQSGASAKGFAGTDADRWR